MAYFLNFTSYLLINYLIIKNSLLLTNYPTPHIRTRKSDGVSHFESKYVVVKIRVDPRSSGNLPLSSRKYGSKSGIFVCGNTKREKFVAFSFC